MSIFEQGQRVTAIFFNDEQLHRVGETCESIIVSMENGQMAEVPWFVVTDNIGKATMWNGALLEGVELLPKPPEVSNDET